MTHPLWTPSENRRQRSHMAAFIRMVNERHHLKLPLEYTPLWEWSVSNSALFWEKVWDFFGVIGDKGNRYLIHSEQMPGARFFPEGRLNFTQNLLADANNRPALIARNENGQTQMLSRAEVLTQVQRLAGWLRANGVGPSDRVGAYMPNIPETVIALLATASLGAVFSSCSIDFGADGVVDRLGQIEPIVLITADGYRYAGREIDRRNVISDITARMPSVRAVVMVPYLYENSPPPAGSCLWREALSAAPITEYYLCAFNDPLVILFSSGTTGAPKCIVHSVGGVLLQHLKELGLQIDVHAGDVVFYFTTCGWMMWNWLVSALAMQAVPVLFEGSPMHPSPTVLWNMADESSVTVFGTSAKYLSALNKAGISPRQTHRLLTLRTICSTGSPLLPEDFSYVYRDIKKDVLLASISGGTDIMSCFVLGNPLDAVRQGKIQCRGLGMAVDIYNDAGQPLRNAPGELVCTAPFPSMPVGFWHDTDGEKYHHAYFHRFPQTWTHGDWATLSDDGTIVIHGRSDATLNPGGVRIGTAEIYRHVEAFKDIAETLAVGQEWQGDQRIILFVRLAEGTVLDDKLRERLCSAIRHNTSPRHVPAKIIAVTDMPRTRSGKISEIAVREIIHGRAVKNMASLANPKALTYFEHLLELQQ